MSGERAGAKQNERRPAVMLRFRYRVVLGCGHRTKPITESTHMPTTAAFAHCDECGRYVPVVVEAVAPGQA